MAGAKEEGSVEVLRRRAERAMDEGRGRLEVEPLLERILSLADEDDPSRLFARRHLAELCLERDPWSAALHLRQVLAGEPADDVAHSLMALAQALLGNYRVAVSSYRRALRIAPENPWYHHNLGHLLDVALDDPRGAVAHFEVALEQADPAEHEITASAAHCFARVGRLAQAAELAGHAVEEAPDNEEHAALLAWIEAGAGPESTQANIAPFGRGAARTDDVAAVLERNLREAGFTRREMERARALWSDYRDERAPRVNKPEVCAAAVHYAICLVLGQKRVTQVSIAKRYGVAPGSISTRYADIRETLALRPHDPRYGVAPPG